MTSTETGSEVLAYCGSCKMDLTAVVVAKVGSKIARVMCKTCKGERTYKAPKGVAEPGTAAPKKASKKKSDSSDTAQGVSIEAEWTRLMKESGKNPRVKYSAKSKLVLGDVVEHPTFGEGIVMRVAHPDKAEILFRSDLKLLIHSR